MKPLILCLEDNQEVFAAYALAFSEYRTVNLKNLSELKAYLDDDSEEPDVFVIDHQLPDGQFSYDHFSNAQLQRLMSWSKIMVTGDLDMALGLKMSRMGLRFLTKPFRTIELMVLVKEAIGDYGTSKNYRLLPAKRTLIQVLDTSDRGNRVQLTEFEINLIERFNFNKDEVEKKELLTLVDGNKNTLRTHVSNINRKFQEAGISLLITNAENRDIFQILPA